MKFVSFQSADGVKLGVVTDKGIVDVRAIAEKVGLNAPSTIEEVIATGETAINQIQQVLSQSKEFIDEAEITYAPAIQKPGKIICAGANYLAHVAESNINVPEFPIYFPKYQSSLAAHNEAIVPPSISKQIDYEVELVAVIGKQAKNVSEEDALDYVFGYSVGNDLSARELQFRGLQWMYGKAIDKFAPIGPYLVTADEITDPQDLNIKCWVNEDLRQSSNTKHMIFPIAEMISDLSKIMTLEPGDVLFTGTPEGVILGREDKVWLKAGDEIVCEVEGVGRLVNRLA
ncbi:2-keto-4-pentenoate hydratase/2-oxohepta-3-ene-1,7-dioic acid hydratase in catechol pathway [Lysinibacillus composti]|uniref:FAA hydrolase family protein n=1 Tax=Lysinibacillus composti TaxID=720633 RepID=A0A3N9UCK0_9BACI|nr:fumarylacetoacetate hydrolase family protein [Lysinibacillus composti]MBM7609297.1 2-keto-4-pentenoate hydratase/2-oxohepta-3-ene-1,7-dioic acid hydratase in catechol pathway [Lysinibacillus composti]RQW74057.1 FAA hydrolase family protein [Lysinibacillus composti]